MVFGFGTSKTPSSVPAPAPPPQDTQDGADSSSKRNLNKPLDIVFLQDTTGSQGPYIKAATKAIRDICDKIVSASEISKEQIRFGLVAFRDHPPQDNTYVTKQFGFTSDIAVMQKNLSSLVAAGGGDGPEAQTAALAAALDMEWADGAIKMVVLITDAPPHGLGEVGDGFTVSPDQNDPLELARQMSEKGITLFVIACEPSLSYWKHAVDFYTALAQITSGRLFPLLMADKLGDFIIGTAVETIETEKLISEFEQVIIDDVYENDKPVESVVNNLQEYIQSKGIQVNTVVMEDVYADSEVARKNVTAWITAKNLGAASSKVATVVEPRLRAEYAGAGARMAGVAPSAVFRTRGRSVKKLKKESTADEDDDEDMGFGLDFGSAPGSAPAPSPPAPMLQAQAISSSQAQRIVMQSMARNSAVTEEGMTSRKTGKVVSTAAIMQKNIK